jgi:hypothetical protein
MDGGATSARVVNENLYRKSVYKNGEKENVK